ncbi:MAG: sulfotransferase domain-containing protein [Acidiferrobacterales bacterium]
MNADQYHPLALDDPRFALVDGRTRPEFMLVGGMKCGSTSFARYVSAHPQVKVPGPKEPNYWSWHRFPARYQDFFVNESPISRPGPGQYVSGEFSTSSLVHPLAPRRIQANLPALKIFVLLRNPVDRAYSHYMMSKMAGLEKECSFEEIVRREMDEIPELLAAHERGFLSTAGESKLCYSAIDGSPICVTKHEQGWPKRRLIDDLDLRDYYFQSYVFRSLYHDQLHRWLRLFPRQQLMIIPSEYFFENEADTMNEVTEFLQLEPFDFQSAGQLQRSWDAGAGNALKMPQAYPAMDIATRRILADFFEPHNLQLYRLIDKNYGWD